MSDLTAFAAEFVHAVSNGEAESACGMMSDALQQATTATELSEQFDSLAEEMGGVTGIGEPLVILEEWPNKSADERAMVYVPLEGDVFSEAVTVTIAAIDDGLRISNVEWGRP